MGSCGTPQQWGELSLPTTGLAGSQISARQIDYWVTVGDKPAEILSHYADATGHTPELPSWASGFWQSKLRYRTQEELLEVAREYHRRGIPLAVIVSDFFHWEYLGDWGFHSGEWPDPPAMVDELKSMGTELMVSVWPSVSPLSANYEPMLDRGLLISSEQSTPVHTTWPERGMKSWIGVSLYDSTNPAARDYIWEQVEKNYYKAGIRVFWLDACEPEMKPTFPASLNFAAGPGLEVANLYPREHARGFYEHMLDCGEEEVLLLCRSAWAGSQRYGAAVWSGDIPSTFESLRVQVRAGLNMAMSGIPWWTTDIGGFYKGDPDDPAYRELFVRWFEYGAFCPLFRVHGDRLPNAAMSADMTGGPNEVWSFGEDGLLGPEGLHLPSRTPAALPARRWQERPARLACPSCARCSSSSHTMRAAGTLTTSSCSAQTYWWLRCWSKERKVGPCICLPGRNGQMPGRAQVCPAAPW